jgi:hypothetical protein
MTHRATARHTNSVTALKLNGKSRRWGWISDGSALVGLRDYPLLLRGNGKSALPTQAQAIQELRAGRQPVQR